MVNSSGTVGSFTAWGVIEYRPAVTPHAVGDAIISGAIVPVKTIIDNADQIDEQ